MRSIETQEEKSRKESRRKVILSMIMLFILVMSSVGFAFFSYQDNQLSGSGDSEISQSKSGLTPDGRWQVQLGGRNLIFSYSPESVALIPLNITSSLQNANPLYLASENEAVAYEIESTLGAYMKIQRACYGVCEKDVPEKDCTSDMIVWRDSQENRVYEDEKCVFIEGDLRSVDAYLFKILDIK